MADRRAGNRSIGRRGRTKLETGTCNVCFAPCSSCMHRNAAFTGSKSDESSDENSHGVVASQCSFNEENLLRSSGVNALGGSHNTASGLSNLVDSDHDAESKEIIRSSDTSDSPTIKRSRKDQDSMKVDSRDVLPKEVKSQSSHGLSPDHQARTISEQGKVKKRSGAEDNEKKKNISSENSLHSEQSGMVEKSGENSLLNEAEEPNTAYMSESESESDESVDVKVCDICGDAGREDLLAICSRCSDGAEHTYCMRIMLKKVPQGFWLCEECKFAEEAEKRKLELELKKAEAKRKRESEVDLNTQISSKRQIDKSEAAPDAKRQAFETSIGSPKRSVLPKLPTLSRETSFRGLEKPTRKLVHHSSFNSHSSDDTEGTRSTDSQLQSPKGSFLKSKSFNCSSSRPKVRPVDDVILPRQKPRKENASLDVKEGFSRNVDKSMLARPTDVGNSRGNTSFSYPNSARDSKNLQSDVRQGSLTKQSRHLSRNRLEDIVASEGDTSTRDKCSSSEAKRKDEVANLGGLTQSREFREAGEKSKDAVGNCQRSDMLSGLKGLTQKGQNAEPTDMSCASLSNPSTTRTIKEDTNKGSNLRAAINAALEKKPSFGKNRGYEQSDLPPVSKVNSSCDQASQNLSLKVPIVRDWPAGLHGGQPNLQTDKQTIAVNGGKNTLTGADEMPASQSVEPEVYFPSVKSVIRDSPVFAPTVLSTAIPEPQYIWQGDLDVQKSRYLSALHSGIQAHLSTLASPKVAEVVNQFPLKVTLNEVPRLSIWPAQFQYKGATEHHVALFFFAKDIESHENSYKPLVENMIQKDLALKGSFQGAELLIFASNLLPQNYQRWNRLFFLWGVFRGKKEKCSVSNGDSGAAEETEEGEIGARPHLRDEKTSGTRTMNPSNMKQKVDLVDLNNEVLCEGPVNKKQRVGTECNISRRDTFASREFGTRPCEEEKSIIKKMPYAKERIVFPLDLNDGEAEDDEMVDSNPRPLGNDDNDGRALDMVPDLKLALGGEKTGTTSTEERRSSGSHKPEDDAASLSLSLSFSSLEKQ